MFYKRLIKKQLHKRGWGPISETNQKNETPTSVYSQNIPSKGINYCEKQETIPENSQRKIPIINEKPVESADYITLNHAASCFIKNAKSIVSIGSETGTFEWFASVDKSIAFTACIHDKKSVDWCKKYRQRDNITYCSTPMSELIETEKKFELALAMEVIDHVYDFGAFISNFSKLANRGIISIVNKDRTFQSSIANTPEYSTHYREWDAGEFYWVLRAFYKNVQLYALPDPFVPKVEKIGLLSTLSPILAVCEK